jgi:hypothetical protein
VIYEVAGLTDGLLSPTVHERLDGMTIDLDIDAEVCQQAAE